jgi:hypothetical protein
VRFVEAADEIEESAPPVARSRSKPKATAHREDNFNEMEALAAAEKAVVEAYYKSLGSTRKGLLVMQVDRPIFYIAVNLLKVRRAVIAAQTVAEKIAVLERGQRFFRQMSQMKVGELEQRRKEDEFGVLELLMQLADPSVDASGWAEWLKPAEFFGRTAPTSANEFEEFEPEAPVKMPSYPEKGTVPIMGGMIIDGLSKNHPMNAAARPKARAVHRVGTAAPGPRVPLTGINNCEEINSHGVRALRDVNGDLQNSQVNSGALKW